MKKYKAFINAISENVNLKDPHFEYDENNLYGAFKKTGEIAYITKTDKEITGLYIWLIMPEDKYIEMIIGLSNKEESFEEMLSFIETNHKRYQLDFVINPQNERFIKILKSRNAIFEEEQQWLDKFRPLLAIHQDTVIGYIDVTYCFEKNEIYDLWVDELFAEKGYELALLQTAIKMNHFISVGFIPVEGTNSIYASYTC